MMTIDAIQDEIKPFIRLSFGIDNKPHFYKSSGIFFYDDRNCIQWNGTGIVYIDSDIFRHYRLSPHIPEPGDTFELLGFQFICIGYGYCSDSCIAALDDLAGNYLFLFRLLFNQEMRIWYRLKVTTYPREHRRELYMDGLNAY